MRKTLLIVDDSAAVRKVINDSLTEAGYEVIEACDGIDALSKLDGKRIHLILSDVNMPHMDGITLVKEIRKLANYRFTPIIMLTKESHQSMKEAGRAAGAKGWVVKPFQAKQVIDAVAKLSAA